MMDYNSKFDNSKPIGYFCVSNTIGIEIMEVEYGVEDSLICRIKTKDKYEYSKCIIYCNDDGLCFKFGEIEVPLSEVLRV